MAQQTTIEWLYNELIVKEFLFIDDNPNHMIPMNEIINQAKAMEKEQIKNSFNDGYCKGDEELSWDDIEKYYNETYNK